MDPIPILLVCTTKPRRWKTRLAEVVDWRTRCTTWYLQTLESLAQHLDAFAPCTLLIDIESRAHLSMIAELPVRWPHCRVIASIDREDEFYETVNLFPLTGIGHDGWTTDDWRRALRCAFELVANSQGVSDAGPVHQPRTQTPPHPQGPPLPGPSSPSRTEVQLGLQGLTPKRNRGQEQPELIQLASDWFQVNRIAWFVEQQDNFTLYAGRTRHASSYVKSDLVVQAILELRHPTRRSTDTSTCCPILQQLHAVMEAEEIEWIVPIHQKETLKGWLWLGGRSDGSDWPAQSADLLSDLAHCASRLQEEPEQDEDSNQEFWPDLGQALAHEIRNPLTMIRTSAQLLTERYEDEAFRETFAQRIETEVTRLDHMVSRLEHFAEPLGAGTSAFDLAMLAKEVAAEFVREGITGIVMDPNGPLPPLLGSQEAMRSCIQHLLRNAIESHTGDPDIEIHVYQDTRKESDSIILDVTDHGQGLPGSVPTKRLFSPFYSTKARGFGLGLPIAQRNMEAYGGHIELLPQADGTRVRLLFPTSTSTPNP